MKKSMSLIVVLAVLVLSFSGCVGDQGPQDNVTEPENSTPAVDESENPAGNASVTMSEGAVKEVPSGFEYLATLPVSVDDIKSEYEAENVSGILDGAKSLYKYSDGTDFYVDVIELEDEAAADNLIFSYKSSFKSLRVGSRFVEEPFNDHFATRIMDYITTGGEQVPRYTYIWKNENFVFVVRGSTDNASLVMEIAKATGN